MPTRLNPYISFKDNAREAMEFYKEVFGGKLTLNTFGEFHGADAGEGADNIMHGALQADNGIMFMAADTPPGMGYREGANISMSLSGEDADELKGYWQKLAEGAKISVPLEKAPWGDTFGMLTDRFGVNWMVNIIEMKSK